MNLLKASEFKVGILVLAAAGLIAFMSMQVSDDPTFFSRGKRAWFLITDAGGLVKNSQIRTAGIPIGTIKDITLQDGQARVDLLFKANLNLTTSASVQIKSLGILGDKYVEVYPGSPTDQPLEDKGQILIVKDKGSLDGIMAQIGEVSSSLKDVTKNLQEALAGNGTREHILGRIVSNIERLTQDISEMTNANKSKVNEIVDQVHNVTKTLNDLINDDSDTGFKKRWKVALDRIDSTMKNVDEIAAKINHGEGTIGKLVSDEQTSEDVSSAIDGVNSFLGGADRMQFGLDFHSDYLGNIGQAKTFVGIQIQPGLDRYYYLGVVDDPAGVVETTDTETTVNGQSGTYTEQKTFHNKLKFNALFAKNFYDFTVRGGLIENSGGVGFDYTLFRNRLKVSLELFEFATLDVRPQIQYQIWRGIYATAGIDDLLNKNLKYSNYLGVGLTLTNDDLKLLITKIPM